MGDKNNFMLNGRYLLAIIFLVVGTAATKLIAHEPIFGIGPHTIFKGGIGIETELEIEKATFLQNSQSRTMLRSEILYGISSEWAVTFSIPTILARTQSSNWEQLSGRGVGDISVRSKYRFWRSDKIGIQDAAAVVLGVKLPTGDADSQAQLGSGSTDFLFGITAARESRRWYYFGDARYRLNGKEKNTQAGDGFFFDAAFGVRPWQTDYLKPDLVFMVEFNFEAVQRDKTETGNISDSGGKSLFLSPGFFLTYRNWAVKTGIQFPIQQQLNGSQPKIAYRLALAVEAHL